MVDGDVDWVGEAVICVEVGRDVDRVGGFVVDSCLVERVVALLRDEGSRDIGAEDAGEGRIVGEEMDGGSVFESVELVRVRDRGRETEQVDCGDGNHDGRVGNAVSELAMRKGRAGKHREELKHFYLYSTHLHS